MGPERSAAGAAGRADAERGRELRETGQHGALQLLVGCWKALGFLP